MVGGVPEFEVRDWKDFVETSVKFEIGAPLERSYIFRGQARADWPLQPSLVRHAIEAGLNAEKVLKIEKAAMKYFQTQAHLYLPAARTEKREDLVSWWTFMQHYGAPTRLLDWTGSIFVAAYFAVEQQLDEPGAMWIIFPHFFGEFRKEKYLKAEFPAYPEAQPPMFLAPDAPPILYFVEQRIQTDRMSAQQTSFTVSTQVLANHGQIIAEALPEDRPDRFARKLIIPAQLKREFLLRLREMNITARALFPGVDGFGRSSAELIKLAMYVEQAPK